MNDTCALSGEFGFPSASPSVTVDAAGVLLRAIPSMGFLVVWALFEAWSARRAGHLRCFRATSVLLVGGLATAGVGWIVWRFFEVLECDGVVETAAWRIVAVAAVVFANLILLLGVGLRYPRLSIATLLSMAGAVLFADWALRGGVVLAPSIDAAPTVALQQLLLTNAVVMLSHLPGRRHRRPTTRATVVPRKTEEKRRDHSLVVDALSTRAPREDHVDARTPAWSWFA